MPASILSGRGEPHRLLTDARNPSGMRTARTNRAGVCRFGLAVAGLVWAGGCGSEPRSTRLFGPYATPKVIAVAPALNFSASRRFDPEQVADLMASELTHVDGVRVIGVNRVLAVLADEGRGEIVSPAHAMRVCERLGADGILVFAITEYDPYEPPVIGMAAQLYLRPESRTEGMAASGPAEAYLQPVAQVQRVFNGAHDEVAEDVRRYARLRDADQSPYGWRKYLVSQTLFLRYCCYAVVRELMAQEQYRIATRMVELAQAEAKEPVR